MPPDQNPITDTAYHRQQQEAALSTSTEVRFTTQQLWGFGTGIVVATALIMTCFMNLKYDTKSIAAAQLQTAETVKEFKSHLEQTQKETRTETQLIRAQVTAGDSTLQTQVDTLRNNKLDADYIYRVAAKNPTINFPDPPSRQ